MTKNNLKGETANSTNTVLQEVFCVGQRVAIPVCAIEFNVGSNTIWIQSPQGGTILRLKCKGGIKIGRCKDSPISHSDIVVDGDINFCLSEDAEVGNH